jgi:hypothetical protein
MGKTVHIHYDPKKANTREETAVQLAAHPYQWWIYTHSGCDDSGKGEGGGAARWGCYIEQIDDELLATVSGRRAVHFMHVKWHSGRERTTALMSEFSGGRTRGRTAV